ncbi:SDR family oxidoreductase [Saccharopolyspora sp. NFXS83]|uniref:SDR family NAD(P)-dependent oxidoreductase n=1 Tax=Saccharopolyspora sp. NFXS83 TaxID=2993560 RepID=UPI00224A9F5F|nr:SDR family oxidoreductase [Saccharopolyspora sp. NFXS83]MCX2729145.1 SDR family oxidoreductase [Saccharopolyspora sp. NFXS83]
MTVPTPGELFGLQGKTALVTGASSGLGARFATVLATAGATVWITARRKEKLDALAATNPALRVLSADLSDEEAREALIAETGAVDVLVNNAGTESGAKPLDETPSGFAGVLGTNLVAPFHLAQLAARAADGGSLSVINVSSILGLVSAAPLGGASYASAKAGLIGLTRELAGHWGGRGVRVNALAPGWFRTEMNDELFADDRSVRWIERNTMLRRAGEGSELDGALLFLASAASSYCTGQVLAVDGGWTAR